MAIHLRAQRKQVASPESSTNMAKKLKYINCTSEPLSEPLLEPFSFISLIERRINTIALNEYRHSVMSKELRKTKNLSPIFLFFRLRKKDIDIELVMVPMQAIVRDIGSLKAMLSSLSPPSKGASLSDSAIIDVLKIVAFNY